MSALNGDKSRFNRMRRQKIARRMRNRELLKSATGKNSVWGSKAKGKVARG